MNKYSGVFQPDYQNCGLDFLEYGERLFC
uniref:Uncharacterized protein n=1 Tax=Rhizophora mucronata TaxID=61149 RepID=A0A2P2NSY7_RHIMU